LAHLGGSEIRKIRWDRVQECDIGEPDEYARAQRERLFETKCPELVQSAGELLEELLKTGELPG
jgi:hypothetical protein